MKNQVYFIILTIIINSIPCFSSYPKTPDKHESFKLIYDSVSGIIGEAKSYYQAGDYEKALGLVRKSHELRAMIYPDTSLVMIKSFVNMGLVHRNIYEYDTALEYLRNAEASCYKRQTEPVDELANIYLQTGEIYKQKGDYELASQYLRQVDGLIKNHVLKNKVRSISYFLFAAEIEMLKGNTDGSLDLFNKGYLLIEKSDDKNHTYLVNYYTGSALTYYTSGNYNKSIELHKKALHYARKDSLLYPIKLAILYNNLGLDYIETNQPGPAGNTLMRALEIYRKLNVKGTYLTELYDNFGKLATLQNDYKKALDYYQKGLEFAAPMMEKDNVFANPEVRQIGAMLPALGILKSKIHCLKELYYLKSEEAFLQGAIASSLTAIELIEYLRNSYQSYESKLQATNHEFEIYKHTLTLLDIAGNKNEDRKYNELIFHISEKSKSSVLMSALREMDARQFGGIPDSLIEREKAISRAVTFYREKIYEEQQSGNPDHSKIAVWEKYLLNAERDHEQLIRFFEKNFPNYFNLKYQNSVIGIRDLQKILPNKTTLIEYSLVNNILYTFIIDRKDFHLVKQELDNLFFDHLKSYLDKFHHFDFSRQNLNEFTEFCFSSNLLYNILIKPAIQKIEGNSLIIVPDGILSYLPFETLIREMPEGVPESQYRFLNFMINDFSVAYSYSATLYKQVAGKNNKKADKSLLAFAPEYKASKADDMEEIPQTRQQYRKNLYPIPGVAEEVNAICKLIPGKVFSGRDATERNFRETCGDYDILHLAMHTVIDNNNPLYSKLIFTINNDSVFDGVLNTYELFGLNINARMIVLSACSTGEGEFRNGEGVLSLARGFVYAGSPSMVMTLWEVEDKTGSELMKYYYKNLLKGQSKSRAMRNAKLTVIKEARPENTHPFFWSSFVVLGNSQPLFTGKIYLFMMAAGLIIITLGVIFLTRKRFWETE